MSYWNLEYVKHESEASQALDLFPYKSLKSFKSNSNFDTFTAMTLKLQEVANFGIFFHVMQTFHFICVQLK